MVSRTQIAKPWLWLTGIIVVYLALAISMDHTYLPWCDEAWFATPGLNLAHDGSFGTSALDETAAWKMRNLRGVNRITYWIMPLHSVAVGAWSFIAGTSLMAVRSLSMAWGLVALAAWFLSVRKLAGPDGLRPALFMAGLLAIDFQFQWCAAQGRMDMMTEALLACSFASYLLLREKNLGRAILVSHSFMIVAGLTHPISLGGLVGLVFLTIYFDWRRIQVKHVALAAVPYIVGLAGWGLFISQDPGMFRDQFFGNVGGRLTRPGGFLHSLWAQYDERFLWMYGFAPDTRGFSHLKILIFLTYLGALGAGWAMRDFREKREYRGWLLFCMIVFAAYANLDKDVHEFYLIHIMSPLIALLALVLDWILRTRRAPVWVVAGVIVLVASIQLMTTTSRIRQDAYHTRYLPTTAFIKRNLHPGELVMGSSELGWELGWNGTVIDDFRLGYLSGKKPDIVVLDKNRYQEWIPKLQETNPKEYTFISNLLDREFVPAQRNDAYVVYLRKDHSAR